MSQNEFLESRCPLCTGMEFLAAQLGLLKCTQCGLVVSPAIWQPQANEELEEEWFGANYQAQTSFWVRWFESWNNRRTLRRLVKAKPSGPRLLEIGVGSGSFLESARKRGFEVMGCDLSSTICERVRRTHGITMHCGTVAEMEVEDRFDVVVMNHVLEHVNEPVAFLRDVLRLLAPGGVVHIAVPNVACWEAHLPGWTSYEPYHLAYFTPETLGRTVSSGGFSIEDEKTYESFSGWFLAVLRTVLGVNRHDQAIQANVRSGRIATNKPRSALAEHAYRLGMVGAGGGDMAAARSSGCTRLWGRSHLHRPQAIHQFGTVMIYGS